MAAVVVLTYDAPAGMLERCVESIVASGDASFVIVVDNGASARERLRASACHVVTTGRNLGFAAGMNVGLRLALGRGEQAVAVVNDDVEVEPGWLPGLLEAARGEPGFDAFGGPIIPRLEGRLRACGQEPPPITSLDYGDADREVPVVWSANMAVRADALQRVGPFDPWLRGRGEEEEWQIRLRQAGGHIRYVAAARLVHRRNPQDSRLNRMAVDAYRLGRTARAFDRRKGSAPPLRQELRTLAGSGWHAAHNRCAYGILFAAHAAGRLREFSAERSA